MYYASCMCYVDHGQPPMHDKPKVEPVLISYLTRRLLGFKSPCTALPSKQLCNDLSASMATSCRASQSPVKRSRRIQPSAGSRYSILITCTRPGHASTGIASFGAKPRSLISPCNCHGYGVATTFATQLFPSSGVTWYTCLRLASCLMSWLQSTNTGRLRHVWTSCQQKARDEQYRLVMFHGAYIAHT